MKKVMIFGTFDVFHKGHESYIQQALTYGSELIVVIARDDNVKKIKAKQALWNEKKRQATVQNFLQKKGRAVLGDKENFLQPLIDFSPHILAFGYDQKVPVENFEKMLKTHNLNVEIVRMNAYKPEMYKSSLLRKEEET